MNWQDEGAAFARYDQAIADLTEIARDPELCERLAERVSNDRDLRRKQFEFERWWPEFFGAVALRIQINRQREDEERRSR